MDSKTTLSWSSVDSDTSGDSSLDLRTTNNTSPYRSGILDEKVGIHGLVEIAAGIHSDSIAIICGQKTLTYRELDDRAKQFACVLIKRGVKCGDVVGVRVGRAIHLVVILLAVLKTGAAYCPMDPTLPAERILRMVENAQPKLIVVDSEQDATQQSTTCIHYSEHVPWSHDFSTDLLDVYVSPNDLAYVMYTSGSTGLPKGVRISHGAAANFLRAMQDIPGVSHTDRGLAISTIAFDMALFELFAPLAAGGTVVLAEAGASKDPQALTSLMETHQITMMLATPTTWQMLLDYGWRGKPRLKHIMCGGESLSRRLADQLLECGDEVWNKYGPTEATACASVWKVRTGEPIVIGDAVANAHLYVLDEHLQPVSIGTQGELFIGGMGVAIGYHRNEKLTQERFLDDPFNGGRMYRTGDLACYSGPGQLTMTGRVDDQVKIRGNRVELGDIESAMVGHPEVSSSAVVSHGDNLVAYYMAQPSGSRMVENSSHVAQWASLSDHVVGQEDLATGWSNSYDGSSFGATEMEEWSTNSVEKILSFAPRRAFEIGAGTGMLLFKIAPSCSSYFATDASQGVVDRVRQQLAGLPHVTYEQHAAHSLPAAENMYDTIIMNSVVQYFPNAKYLLEVLEWAVAAVDTGRVFLGDVRDSRLLEVFHRDIWMCRTKLPRGDALLEKYVSDAVRDDPELLVSPYFFLELPSILSRISSVEITLRNGSCTNEMTQFRYDVVLHIGEPKSHLGSKELDWQEHALNMSSAGGELRQTDKNFATFFSGIPNGRLREVYLRQHADDASRLDSQESWVDPSVLANLGREQGLEYALLPSRHGDIWLFDIVFWNASAATSPNLQSHLDRKRHREPIETHVRAAPTKSTNAPEIGSTLRRWLSERLPEYMVPAFFVKLEKFPLTFNGKIDRKALPKPTQEQTQDQRKNIEPPRTSVERDIAAAWSSVLDREDIGINENFFEIGGNSIRLVQVQVALRKALDKTISIGQLFENYTIKMLAESISSEHDSEEFTQSQTRVELVSSEQEDIAVVSMSCRLPGGVNTPEEFWDLLDSGRDVISMVPPARWEGNHYYDTHRPGSTSPGPFYGGFLDTDLINSCDLSFFRLSQRQAEAMDPAHRVMLETSWEAFERAGYAMDVLRGSSTGVFIGVTHVLAHHEALPDLGDFQGYEGTGSALAATSGQVSYTFGLQGPCMTIDTACASSVVSTHLACAALRQGECDMAMAGAVSLLETPAVNVEFQTTGGLAADGCCGSFSEDAHGAVFAEGASAVVLKRLSDAKRDGDVINAIIRGSAVNHSGQTASLTTPSAAAQRNVIHRALAVSRLTPSDIQYVEAHGTATKLGDPIEGEALAQAYGKDRGAKNPLFVGSVKSNIGHIQGASGMVGLLKVVLSLQHQCIPQSLHSEIPTPAIDWEAAQMQLVQKKTPWISRNGRKRRGGVTAIGFTGTNAHMIVEEYPCIALNPLNEGESVPSPPTQTALSLPVLISGLSPQALRNQAEKLRSHLMQNDVRLLDVASTLAKRTHFPHRHVFLVEDRDDLIQQLGTLAGSVSGESRTSTQAEPRIALLFTGQGGRLANAGKVLAERFPVFRQSLEDVASRFDVLEHPLLDVMWAADHEPLSALLYQTNYAQPALFALQVSLWRLWQSLGIKPSVVLGHSVGEIAAAHVAGIMSLPDAAQLVAARGQLMHEVTAEGAMFSIEANHAEVEKVIQKLGLSSQADIAACNTPKQTVVSGDCDAVEQVAAALEQQGCRSKRLSTARAFHSHHMSSVLPRLLAVAERISFSPSDLPIVSGMTGRAMQYDDFQKPTYWSEQARRSVNFETGMQTLRESGATVFLELGSAPILCGLGAACSDEANVDLASWCPSLDPNRHELLVINQSLSKMHRENVQIQWSKYFDGLYGGSMPRIVNLPTYAFQRTALPARRKKPQAQLGNGKLQSAHEIDVPADVSKYSFLLDWKSIDHVGTPSRTGQWGLFSVGEDEVMTARVLAALQKSQTNVKIIKDLADGEYLDGVLCLWASQPMTPSLPCTVAQDAISQLQWAVRQIFKPVIVWVTASVLDTCQSRVQDDDSRGLTTTVLSGLLRSARAEHPELDLRSIDVTTAADTLSLEALSLALDIDAEPDILIRDGALFALRIDHAGGEYSSNQAPWVRADGTVLITGAFGTLGKNIARWLVSQHGVRDFVLVGRRGMDTPGAHSFIAELESLGASVVAAPGDIGDEVFVRALKAQIDDRRPLRGVIHAAGTSDSGVLMSLEDDSCGGNFQSKVNGAWNLHHLTKTMDLDFFVLCSSLSTVLDTSGLVTYAAANSFLNGIAAFRTALGLPATSMVLGPFESEMTSGLTELERNRLSATGFLSPDSVLQAIQEAVLGGNAVRIVGDLDSQSLKDFFDSRGGVPPTFSSLFAATSEECAQEQATVSSLREKLAIGNAGSPEELCLREVIKVVAQVLGFAEDNVDPETSLRDMGMDSFSATLLRNGLNRLSGAPMSMKEFFSGPTPSALSRLILATIQSNESHLTVQQPDQSPLDRQAIAAGVLDHSFTFENTQQNPDHSHVLVTGATGFVGAFMTHEFLERGMQTWCIVRAEDSAQARHRLVQTLVSYDLWDSAYDECLHVLSGDLGMFRCGLSEDSFESLATKVGLICHAAGFVDWMRPFEEYVGPNIVSTHEILRLANTGRVKIVHFISTIATLPFHSGHGYSEDQVEYGYATSKWAAERLIEAARWRGAKASIYRLPFVAAASSSGRFRRDERDFLHNLIVGSIEMGAFPRIGGDISLILPVDYLSRTVASIMIAEPERIGQSFDFRQDNALSFASFIDWFSDVATETTILPFEPWKEQAMQFAAANPKSALARIRPVLRELSSGEDAADMFRGTLCGRSVLGGSDHPVPPFEQEYVSRYFRCIQASLRG